MDDCIEYALFLAAYMFIVLVLFTLTFCYRERCRGWDTSVCRRWIKGLCLSVFVTAMIGYLICIFSRKDESSGGPYRIQAVATDHKECSKIGSDILNSNGSAVDAAIAATFCLGVTNMHSSGVGGGGVMLVYIRKLKKAKVIDFRETAPGTTTSDMFPPNEIGEDMSERGGLAIAVPGEVHGLHRAWKEYHQLPWETLVQPAIDLARDGFPISAAVAEVLSEKQMVMDIKDDSGLSELLLDINGEPYGQGTIIKNEKYAMTLEIIRDDPESFYNGPLAMKISQDITKSIPDKQRKGQVTEQDLRKYKTVIRQPLESKLAGMKMLLTPPPTSGAVLGLVLNILKGYDLTSSARDGTKASVLTYHRIIEAFKFAYAWRGQLGDPDPRFNKNKKINQIAQKMIQQQFGDDLRRKIKDNGTYKDVSFYAPSYSDADYGTTHLAVLAKNGDAVSVTSTINYRFGCLYRSTHTGIIYNNQMADFDIPKREKGGVKSSEVNSPEAYKRPFSSMSPAILTNDSGDVQLIIGASGGKRIATAVSLVLMNKVWFGKSLSDAVDDPRVHQNLVPEMNVEVEKKKKYRLSKNIQDGLRALGHKVMVASDSDFAVVQAVYRKTGEGIYAKSDPRKYGAPAGG